MLGCSVSGYRQCRLIEDIDCYQQLYILGQTGSDCLEFLRLGLQFFDCGQLTKFRETPCDWKLVRPSYNG